MRLSDSSTRVFDFDGRGLLTSSTDGAGITQTYAYFDSSAPQKEGYLKTRTMGVATTTYDVDARGNVVSVQDQEGRATTYQVNKLDQVEAEVGAFSQAKPNYNAAGQVVYRDRLTGKDVSNNPVFTRTSYDVDELDRLKSQTESSGTLSSFSTYGYDPAGNLKTVSRTAAPTVSFTHDNRDRVTGVDGSLITVGGIGDINANPADPNSPPVGKRSPSLHKEIFGRWRPPTGLILTGCSNHGPRGSVFSREDCWDGTGIGDGRSPRSRAVFSLLQTPSGSAR